MMANELDRLRWRENLPFWLLHGIAGLLAVLAGWSLGALIWLIAGYAVRMFVITGFYHRYFSHRTYRTSRVFQFFMALSCHLTAQKGALWWAAHHRRHHKYSDKPEDIHSPRQRGFWWSHVFWILAKRHRETDVARIGDFAKYPELRFLDKWEIWVTVAFGGATYLAGYLIDGDGLTALAWGFFVPIMVTWHATFLVNSLAHVWGRQRYATGDDSRNNAAIAVLTFGEGWHNNHHHYQRSARQGFYWWEVDVTYYGLKLLELLRIVRDVEGVPRHIRDNDESPARARLAKAA